MSDVSFGRLNPSQTAALAPYMRDAGVVDLGAGQCALSAWALYHRAAQVVAVDAYPPERIPEGVHFIQGRFDQLPVIESDVAILSWPSNEELPGLKKQLDAARAVAFLGKNSDGAYCGSPRLYRYLITRKLLNYVPALGNSLIIVGGPGERAPTGEEAAGLDIERVWSWHDVIEYDKEMGLR